MTETRARYSTDLVVIDLEACCPDQDTNDVQRSNIIEIGAVRLARRTLEIVDTFSELVRPRDYPITPFIAELTGITPEMVSSCDTFDAVGTRFFDWYGPRNRSVLAAWGVYYDLPLLRKECDTFGLDFKTHCVGGALDVRTLALAWLAENHHSTTGLTLERTRTKMKLTDSTLATHRALDDARATAAILQFYHLRQAHN